jgi:activator of HSP90 ATPase
MPKPIKPIVQSVTFPVRARELYDIFLNSRRHSAFTGGKVKISAKAGSAFSAFNGILSGTTLWTVPGELLVQRWRSTQWKKGDGDSILVVAFSDVGKKGRIDLVHVNVPAHDHKGVTAGWRNYYWEPLKAYVRGKKNPGKLAMEAKS